MSDVPFYHRGEMPSGAFGEFRKVAFTKAIRIFGPFTVQTREGILSCEDGWLAIDANGWPYPIADDEFRLIYEPTDDSAAKMMAPK